MIIHIKHDTANGEVGVSSAFEEMEKSVVNRFRQQFISLDEYVPSNSLDNLPFASLIASYFLTPSKEYIAITYVYVDNEVLRQILSFITLRIPIKQINPFVVATNILHGSIRKELFQSIKARKFEIQFPDTLTGRRLPIAQNVNTAIDIRHMAYISESDLLADKESVYRPFITYKPFVDEKFRVPEKSTSRASVSPKVEYPSELPVIQEPREPIEERRISSIPFAYSDVKDSKKIKTEEPLTSSILKGTTRKTQTRFGMRVIYSFLLVAIVTVAISLMLSRSDKKNEIILNPELRQTNNDEIAKEYASPTGAFEIVKYGDPYWLYYSEVKKSSGERKFFFSLQALNDEYNNKLIVKGLPVFLISSIEGAMILRTQPNFKESTKIAILKPSQPFIFTKNEHVDQESDPEIQRRWWEIQPVNIIYHKPEIHESLSDEGSFWIYFGKISADQIKIGNPFRIQTYDGPFKNPLIVNDSPIYYVISKTVNWTLREAPDSKDKGVKRNIGATAFIVVEDEIKDKDYWWKIQKVETYKVEEQ